MRSLQSLLECNTHIWKGDQLAHSALSTVPTGFAELDLLLPGGGWPLGVLTEILNEHMHHAELPLLLPALASLCKQEQYIACIAPPHILYASTLIAAGIELSHVLIIQPRYEAEILWAMEQALRSGACAAVIGWSHKINERAIRRLQLAAETGQTWGVLFRNKHVSIDASPAPLRIQLLPQHGGLNLRILKRRGSLITQSIYLPLFNYEKTLA